MQLPLFVYGTLKPGGSNYPRYLAGRTVAEQPASLAGAALYTEGAYPYLVINAGLASRTERVNGVLVTIRPHVYAKTLALIDDLEDYRPDNPWNEYERITQRVQTATGQAEAWVYVAGPSVLPAIRVGRLTKVPGGTWR